MAHGKGRKVLSRRVSNHSRTLHEQRRWKWGYLCINQRKPDGTDAVCSNLFPNRGCDCSIYTECPRWNFAMIKM